MENMIARIEQLKQEKDVAIVAHYYVRWTGAGYRRLCRRFICIK